MTDASAPPNPALADISEPLDGVFRIETHPRSANTALVVDKIRSVYPHQQIYGFCPVQGYVDAPPRGIVRVAGPIPDRWRNGRTAPE